MNNHFYEAKTSSNHHHRRWNKRFRFGAKDSRPKRTWQQTRSPGIDYVQLASGEASGSDEEIVLHDVTSMRKRGQGHLKCPSTVDPDIDNRRQEPPDPNGDPFLHCDMIPLELSKGDTLHGISVKYGCPIADIKRANHIISNQEFYGLRKLVIPARKHGLLSQIIKSSSSLDNGPVPQTLTINVGLGSTLSSSPQEDAFEFLRKMDEDLIKIINSTKTKKDSLEEAAASLTACSIHPLTNNRPKKRNTKKKYCFYITVFAVVFIVLPVLIILYMEHFNLFNHSDDSINQTQLTNKER